LVDDIPEYKNFEKLWAKWRFRRWEFC
jgi:hypothetical protein